MVGTAGYSLDGGDCRLPPLWGGKYIYPSMVGVYICTGLTGRLRMMIASQQMAYQNQSVCVEIDSQYHYKDFGMIFAHKYFLDFFS